MKFPHLIEHEANFPIAGTPSIERWLFPDGWDRSNKGKYWENLPKALERMARELSYVPVNGGKIAMIFPSVIPTARDFPLVEFTIRVPRSAAAGAVLSWDYLRKCRLRSASDYRAYLSAMAFLDRSAHRGHGITAEIAAPILGADGKPKRRKGGKILRSETEFVENPSERYVKPLNDYDLTRMIGLDPDVKRRREDARKAFDRLHGDGVIDLKKDGRGWRIFAPSRKPGG